MSTTYFLEGVDRVMKVLDAFTADEPQLRLTDLSDRSGIPKPQVLRILSTLETRGYVERDPRTKRYRLGLRLFELGAIVRQEMDLRRVAQPWLDSLAEATLETVALVVLDALGPVCVEVVESPKGLRVFAQVGRRMPWNAGTSGKVTLAYLAEETREQILARTEFKRYTNLTVTDPDALRKELRDIRRRGYHVSAGDLDEDALGMSAPIFDEGGTIVAAVSVVAPLTRLSGAESECFVNHVCETAAAISRRLGHRRRADEEAADD